MATPGPETPSGSPARANASLEGRDFVIPDYVKQLMIPVMRHRLILTASSEVEGMGADDVLRGIASSVRVPR